MQVSYNAGGIEILYRCTNAPSTIVVFAAKGLPPSLVPRTEYQRELKALNELGGGSVFNIVMVIDNARRFYIDGKLPLIVDEVNRLLARFDTQNAVTIGLSMGGFAAVAYARRLRACNKVIAFGAHSSIHPDIVPRDLRSPELRSRICKWDVVDCLDELDDGIDYHLFYGEDDEDDAVHADRFVSAAHPRMHIERVPGCGHNVVDFWTRGGQMLSRLRSLLAPMLADEASIGSIEDVSRPDVSAAGLHVIADGIRIDAVWNDLVGRFHVPPGARDVALVSRTVRPCDISASTDDRQLGVSLSGLTLIDGFAADRRIAIDDPCLHDGFHHVEDGCRRWTSGRTPLPQALLAQHPDGFFLRVELAGPSLW